MREICLFLFNFLYTITILTINFCYGFAFCFLQIRLICFQLVSSTTLEMFMKDESVAVQNSKLLCRLATDVLQALRFIASCGIHHNKITMQNILIQKTEERVRSFSCCSRLSYAAFLPIFQSTETRNVPHNISVCNPIAEFKL